jgi:hypothetical protein
VHPAVVRASRVFALVRIELHQGDATVTVTDGGGKSPAVQREVYGSESAAVFRETLAHIILGSVEPLAVSRSALRSQTDEGAPNPVRNTSDPVRENGASAPRDIPLPESSTEVKTRRVSLALGYRGGPMLVSTSRGAVAFGAQGTATLEGALRPSLSIDASYVIPPRVSEGGLNASIGLVPLRLRAAIEAYAWPSLALETAIVGGIDLVSLSPSSSDASLQVAPETRRVQPILGGAISGRTHLAPALDLVIGLGLDVDLAPRRWLVASDLTSNSFFELARVRPSASLGMMWTFGGAPPPTLDSSTVAQRGASYR